MRSEEVPWRGPCRQPWYDFPGQTNRPILDSALKAQLSRAADGSRTPAVGIDAVSWFLGTQCVGGLRFATTQRYASSASRAGLIHEGSYQDAIPSPNPSKSSLLVGAPGRAKAERTCRLQFPKGGAPPMDVQVLRIANHQSGRDRQISEAETWGSRWLASDFH